MIDILVNFDLPIDFGYYRRAWLLLKRKLCMINQSEMRKQSIKLCFVNIFTKSKFKTLIWLTRQYLK